MASAPAAPVTEPMASAAPQLPLPAPRAGNKLPVILGAVALVALAAVAFVVFGGAKTGTIAVSVSGPGDKAVDGVVVSVDGQEVCQDSVCTVTDLEKGSHKVSVEAPGYAKSAPRLVAVKAGEESVVSFTLQPAGGGTGLRVSTKASGLSLKIDGKEIGPLPQELTAMKPGPHDLEVSGSPFIKPFKKTVTVRADEVTAIEPELELDHGQVTIKLGENAEGADIYLVGGGKRRAVHKAKLPLIVDIPADKEFKLVASKAKFEGYEEVLTFSVEEPQRTYEVSLIPLGAERPSRARSGAATTPTTAPSPAPAAAAAPVAATPAPAAAGGSGTLNINSIPVSTVILDGRPLGTTPKIGVSVPAGAHTIVFVHPQHGRKTRTVTVSAGATATAAVRFP